MWRRGWRDTRQHEQRAAASLRAHATRRLPHYHRITTLVRSALFARICRRRDAAPFSRARGRRQRTRAPGSHAINAAVVNERRPRPGG